MQPASGTPTGSRPTLGGPSKPRRGFAVASLVLGILGLPTLGLVGVGGLLGIVFGIVAMVKASRSPREYGGKGMAVAGIALSVLSLVVMPFLLGIVAAVAIPSLLRARISANEAAALSDIRAVITAEASYQQSNGGFYDTLECLVEPPGCVPRYSGPPYLLDKDLAKASKTGYTRVFSPGPPASVAPGTMVSKSSMGSFAYFAIPAAPNRTGVRSFCGDDSGVIRASLQAFSPEVLTGSCPADWPPLQ